MGSAESAAPVRLVVRVSAACPALLEQLLRVPARGRAERLRALALVGLATLRGPHAATPAEAPASADTPGQDTRRRLLQRLGADLTAEGFPAS